MNIVERNNRIYREHKAGVSYIELNQKYGISSQTIRRVVEKEERNLTLANDEVFSLLSAVSNDNNVVIRIYKILNRVGIRTRDQFIGMKRETYEKFRGIGKASALVIEAAQQYCQTLFYS